VCDFITLEITGNENKIGGYDTSTLFPVVGIKDELSIAVCGMPSSTRRGFKSGLQAINPLPFLSEKY
jgi:hypothetical protein